MEKKTLDEIATFAAFNYVDNIEDGGTSKHPWNDEDVERGYEQGFKDGVKWLSEQGISFEDTVFPTSCGDNDDSYQFCTDGEGELRELTKAVKEGEFNVGDKVIIQIRKIK